MKEENIFLIDIKLAELEILIEQNDRTKLREERKSFNKLFALAGELNGMERHDALIRINRIKKRMQEILKYSCIQEGVSAGEYMFPITIVNYERRYSVSEIWLQLFEALHILGFSLYGTTQVLNLDDSKCFLCKYYDVKPSIAEVKGIVDFVVSHLNYQLVEICSKMYFAGGACYIVCVYNVFTVRVIINKNSSVDIIFYMEGNSV